MTKHFIKLSTKFLIIDERISMTERGNQRILYMVLTLDDNSCSTSMKHHMYFGEKISDL